MAHVENYCAVDPGIVETVAALHLFGCVTSQSCQGHLDHGFCAPWVRLATDDDGVVVSPKVSQLIEIVRDFNDLFIGRGLYHIILEHGGLFTIQGLALQGIWKRRAREEFLVDARKVMFRFTEFLKGEIGVSTQFAHADDYYNIAAVVECDVLYKKK